MPQFQSLGHWAALKSALVQARPKPVCPSDYSLQIEPKGYAAKTDHFEQKICDTQVKCVSSLDEDNQYRNFMLTQMASRTFGAVQANRNWALITACCFFAGGILDVSAGTVGPTTFSNPDAITIPDTG